MNFSSDNVEKALTDGHRSSIGFLVGLTIGCAAAAAACYGVSSRGYSADLLVGGILVLIVLGWGVVAYKAVRASARAKEIADILSDPNVHITFDTSNNRLVLETAGSMQLGDRVVPTTKARVVISLQEAQRIGFTSGNTTPLLGDRAQKFDAGRSRGPEIRVDGELSTAPSAT